MTQETLQIIIIILGVALKEHGSQLCSDFTQLGIQFWPKMKHLGGGGVFNCRELCGMVAAPTANRADKADEPP